MELRLTHLALQCQDIMKNVNFYKDYCEMSVLMKRASMSKWVYWLGYKHTPGLVLVLLEGTKVNHQLKDNYSHIGFAVEKKNDVIKKANQARKDEILLWEPTQQDPPVGFFCGVKDPENRIVEFSYGQPL